MAVCRRRSDWLCVQAQMWLQAVLSAVLAPITGFLSWVPFHPLYQMDLACSTTPSWERTEIKEERRWSPIPRERAAWMCGY